jgi:hypothetical protein
MIDVNSDAFEAAIQSWYSVVNGIDPRECEGVPIPPANINQALVAAIEAYESTKAVPPQVLVKIPWFGGECPVPPETKVRAHLRCGETWEAAAEFCDWSRSREFDDTSWHIIAYEVLT